MKIDFVSDVSCPWCAVGFHSLQAAIAKLDGEIETELFVQPFELNPHMSPEGVNAVAYLSEKLHASAEQIERSQAMIVARGAEVGFKFDLQRRTHIYNTFDAHRLLFWANQEGKQRALKLALFAAYFTDGRDPSDRDVLIELAIKAGLDAQRAREILESNAFAAEVRDRERFYAEHGIHGVPAVIVNDRHLIQGAQPTEVFERVLRQLAAGPV